MLFASLWIFSLSANDKLNQMVHIKGKRVSANGVIAQLMQQTGLNISSEAKDDKLYRKDYDHITTVRDVLQAYVEYHKEHNKTNLRVVDRGHGQIRIFKFEKNEAEIAKKVSKKGKIILGHRNREELPKSGVIIGLVIPSGKDAESRRRALFEKRRPSDEKETKTVERGVNEPVQVPTSNIEREAELASVSKKQKIEVLDLVGLKDKRKDELKKVPTKELEKKDAKPKKKIDLNIETGREINLVKKDPPPAAKKKKEKKPAIDYGKHTRPSLQVEILRDNRLLSQTGVPLELDSFFGEEEKANPKASNLKERLKDIDDLIKSPLDKHNFSDFDSGDFSGVQSGFLHPEQLPSKILAQDKQSLRIGFSFAMQDEQGLPVSFEKLDATLYQLRGQYKRALMENFEAVVETKIGLHTGEFQLAGATSRDLDASFGDTSFGINSLIYKKESLDLRIMGGVRLKAPTGSKDNMLSTGDFDGAVYAAAYRQWHRYTQFAQIGFTSYGDHDVFKNIETKDALSAMLGLSYDSSDLMSFHGQLLWSESPYREANLPDFYEDDIFKLQLGLVSRAEHDAIGVNVFFGFTDSSTDIGAQLNWNKFLE